MLCAEEGVVDRCTLCATDLNEAMIAVARLGSYPLERIRRYEEAYRESGGRGSLADHYAVVGRSAPFHPPRQSTVTGPRHTRWGAGSSTDFHLTVCANVFIFSRNSFQH